MWAAIITVLGSWALKAFEFCFGGKQQAAGVAQGRAEEDAAVAGHNASTEAAIAQAEADAPKTNEEALARLRAHDA